VSPSELAARLDAERRGMPFVLYLDDAGRQHIVELGGEATALCIGRRPTNDIAIPWDPEVSRAHAVLERVGDEWTIADDGLSKNGTFVNGEAVRSRRRLSSGDTIFIGATFLTFRCETGIADPQSGAGTVSREGPHAAVHVTATELEILRALCRPFKEGLAFGAPATNKDIADEVYLSVDAVKAHLTSLFQKFGLSDLPQNQKRLHLVERALVSGIVGPRDL